MKLFVPTDFSPLSSAAGDLAVQIARLAKGEVIFHHAFSSTVDWVSVTREAAGEVLPVKEDVAHARARLAALEEQYADVQVRTQLSYHETVDELMEEAERAGVDWIVAATRGRKDLSNKIMGSDTQRMIRLASCPTITIQEPVPFPWRRLLLVTDLNEDIAPCVAQLLTLSELMQAEVHLGYVNSPVEFKSTEEAEARMQALEEQFPGTAFRLHIYNHLRIDIGIRKLAARVGADALALVTHRHSAWFRLFSQSLTETIALDSPVPVISFHH